MQQDEGNHHIEFASGNETPKRSQRTPQNVEFVRRNTQSEDINRRIHCTPRNSSEIIQGHSSTPQCSGLLKKYMQEVLPESSKRKIQSAHNESIEKIQKTSSSGKFVNTLIEQWFKYVGNQTPLSQMEMVQESPNTEKMKCKQDIENETIRRLKEKLQIAEKKLSTLSATCEAELRAKEEILEHLNNDWESITKYYSEISESLKEFKKHKDHLTKLYNDVILVQKSKEKKLEQQLSTMKLKDEEHSNIVKTFENAIANYEERIQKVITAEAGLKKKLEDTKNESVAEKNHLHNVYTEEKMKLIKTQENLTSTNRDLQMQLKKIAEDKQSLSNIIAQKDEEISELGQKIVVCKNEVENLLCCNSELTAKYEKAVEKEEELSKELQLKTQEMNMLQQNLTSRQEIQCSLAKDLDMIDNKCKNMQNDLKNVENKFKEAQIRNMHLEKTLEETEIKNEREIVCLNRKIERLEKEKEQVVSEKNSKIQERDNSYKILKEKYEAEVTLLKREYDVKLAEMKKVISMHKKEVDNDREKECHDKLLENSKERLQHIAESNVTDTAEKIKCHTQTNKAQEIKEQQFQNQGNMNRLKIRAKEKSEIPNTDSDIYNFSVEKMTSELQNEKSHIMGKKRIFKTRNSGLRQYGTPKKLQYETPGKMSEK